MSNRIMIASDLHGSSYYVRKLLDRYRIENCNKLILLGDFLYHGPRNDLPFEYEVREVSKMLNELSGDILAIRGNCDAEVDQNMFEFPMLQDSLLLSIDSLNFFATHGHIYNESNLPALKNMDVLLNGHFHTPVFKKKEYFHYVNPGSTSIPRGGSTNSFIIYEDRVFYFYDLNKEQSEPFLIGKIDEKNY